MNSPEQFRAVSVGRAGHRFPGVGSAETTAPCEGPSAGTGLGCPPGTDTGRGDNGLLLLRGAGEHGAMCWCRALRAVHYVPCTVCHTLCAMHRVPYAMCHAQCAIHYVPCTTHCAPRAMHHAPCTMRCAPQPHVAPRGDSVLAFSQLSWHRFTPNPGCDPLHLSAHHTSPGPPRPCTHREEPLGQASPWAGLKLSPHQGSVYKLRQ